MQYLVDKSHKIWNPNRVEEGKPWIERCYRVLLGQTSIGGSFQVTIHPTDNCQFASIGQASVILNSSSAVDILKDIYAIVQKPMFMFDLKGSYISKLKELFPKSDIVMESPYISTNGSNMTLFLVKTSILI